MYVLLLTKQSTEISPNSLVWKFWGKAQILKSFRRFVRDSAETVQFNKISTPANYVKLRYFTQWFLSEYLKVKKIVHSRAYLFYLFSYQNVDLARQEIVKVRGSIKRSFFELSKWSKGISIKKSTLLPIIKTIEGNNFNATRVTKRHKLTIFFQTNKSKVMIVKRETRAIDWSLKAYLIIGSS